MHINFSSSITSFIVIISTEIIWPTRSYKLWHYISMIHLFYYNHSLNVIHLWVTSQKSFFVIVSPFLQLTITTGGLKICWFPIDVVSDEHERRKEKMKMCCAIFHHWDYSSCSYMGGYSNKKSDTAKSSHHVTTKHTQKTCFQNFLCSSTKLLCVL